MTSGRISRKRSFLSMSFGLVMIGTLLQLLLLGTTRVTAEIANPPVPPISSTTTTRQHLATSTVIVSSKAPTTTPKTTTRPAPVTTDSMSCWSSSNRTSDACYSCNICNSGPSGGAVAGIVIAVLILYIVSLMLVAILVSVLTKRGTLDLSNWRHCQIISTVGKAKSTSTELAEPNDYTEEGHPSSGDLYTALDSRTRMATPAEPSPYAALQVDGRKKRNANQKVKRKPTTPVETAESQATDDEIYQNY